MKQKIILTIGLYQLCLNGWGQQAQTPYTAPFAATPAQAVTTANAAWYRGGNNNTGPAGNANIFGTLWNSPIYTQTNGVTRMVLMGTNPPGGITGALGLGPTLTNPQAFLHVSNITTGAFSPNGRLFRTDGLNSISNSWSMWLTNNAGVSFEQFRIANTVGGGNRYRVGTVSNRGLDFTTSDISRITILPTITVPYDRSGFVGFNNAGPLFHLDIRTQNPNDGNARGELIFRGRITDDDDAYISFVNLATNGPVFIPTLLSRQSGNPQTALTTVGSITNGQDAPGLTNPVTRFVSARGYDPVATPFVPNLVLARINVIQQRPIFGWQNGVDELMLMRANGFLGVGTSNPGNRVEINSDFYAANGQPTGTNQGGPSITALTANGFAGSTGAATGFSGLRFSDLNANSIPRATNPGTGVLAVDENGDVVYVAGGTGNGNFGGNCTDPTAGLLPFDTKVDLNNYNLYFTRNDALNTNQIAFGYDCGTALEGKVNVYSKNERWSGSFYVDGNSPIDSIGNSHQGGVKSIIDSTRTVNATSIYGYVAPNNFITMVSQIGVKGEVLGRSVKEAVGVFGESKVTVTNSGAIGGRFFSSGSGSARAVQAQNQTSQINATPFSGFGFGGDFSSVTALGQSVNSNTGVAGSASGNAAVNVGVRGIASGNGTINWGVYGTASGPGANRAGYFNGNVEAINGTFISDQQFKTNVTAMNNGLKIITQLKPVNYHFDTISFPQFNFGTELQIGFIAQQVESVLPNLVYEGGFPAEYDSLGNEITPATTYKSLNYNGLIPINTQAIIELNQKVDKATLSDQTIKTNVQDLNGSLNKVLQMRGVSYDWNQTVNPNLNLDSANHIGFIAQEIQQIDPRLTFSADDSLLHVEYDKVVPILAEAIEELNNTVEEKDSIINDLNNRLTNLENCLSALLPTLCQMNQSAIQANTPAAQEAVRQNLQVTLSNRSTIILDQNVPNPFAEQTVINFSIPASVAKAQMHFYDGNGRLIQTLEIAERGLGAVTVFGSDLSSGTYTYTLVAVGAVVATKKMMKQ
jgi:hypothetical protein